jgi:hypothetical protein
LSKKGIFYMPRTRGGVDLYDQWVAIVYDYEKDSYNMRGSFRREKDVEEVENTVTTVISFYRKANNVST